MRNGSSSAPGLPNECLASYIKYDLRSLTPNLSHFRDNAIPDDLSRGSLARLAGMDAGVVFCRRSDFETIGGYDESLLFAEDVKLLLDLKRLGRPRGERFVRARGAITITSARKFDKHGEWHFLAAMPKSLWWAMFSRNSIDQWARNYWYEDR